MSATKDMNWEIEQIWLAIEYFETAIENAWSTSEVRDYESSIHTLISRLRGLEHERDKG